MKLITMTNISLDGVMQGLGDADEDRRGGSPLIYVTRPHMTSSLRWKGSQSVQSPPRQRLMVDVGLAVKGAWVLLSWRRLHHSVGEPS